MNWWDKISEDGWFTIAVYTAFVFCLWEMA